MPTELEAAKRVDAARTQIPEVFYGALVCSAVESSCQNEFVMVRDPQFKSDRVSPLFGVNADVLPVKRVLPGDTSSRSFLSLRISEAGFGDHVQSIYGGTYDSPEQEQIRNTERV